MGRAEFGHGDRAAGRNRRALAVEAEPASGKMIKSESAAQVKGRREGALPLPLDCILLPFLPVGWNDID
jgi:hypothetical protein